MKINRKEVTRKETIVEYIAIDGTTFQSQEECELYEKSALCAVKKTLKKLHTKDLSECDIFGNGFDENYVEIYDVKSAEDLVHLKMYCQLEAKGGGRLDNLDKLTVGHEVVIFWNCERDWYWTQGDGSIKSILNRVEEQFKYAMSKDTEDTKDTDK